MTRGRWPHLTPGDWGLLCLLAVIVTSVGLTQLAQAQPAPNNCGVNMLCRVRDLIVSGTATFAGRVVMDGGATFNGDLTVNGDAGVAGDATIGDDLIVTDDLSATTMTFLGGGTPCLQRGGNTTVATCSGDGFASLGAGQGQSTWDVWDSWRNTANGANCTGNTGAVCVNDTGGFAVADGAGATVATISAAGLATVADVNATASTTVGAIVLVAGTGTATVKSGDSCVCVDRTAVQAVQCAVSGTTLTATGNATDTIVYICL